MDILKSNASLLPFNKTQSLNYNKSALEIIVKWWKEKNKEAVWNEIMNLKKILAIQIIPLFPWIMKFINLILKQWLNVRMIKLLVVNLIKKLKIKEFIIN